MVFPYWSLWIYLNKLNMVYDLKLQKKHILIFFCISNCWHVLLIRSRSSEFYCSENDAENLYLSFTNALFYIGYLRLRDGEKES